MNIVNRIHQSFNAFKDSIAISDGIQNITYGDLYQKSLKIAGYVSNQQINQSCIAVSVTDPIEHISTLLGILMSGNYYISVTSENRDFFVSQNALQFELIITDEIENYEGMENNIVIN